MIAASTAFPTLPRGLVARARRPEDLERANDFLNRHSPVTSRMTIADARRWAAMARADEPGLEAIVDEPSGGVAALANVDDGHGHFDSPGLMQLGLRVDDPWKGSGVGTALLNALEAFAAARGATRLISAVRGDEDDGLRFASKHGYAEFHRRSRAWLDLGSFDPSHFDDPRTIAARADVRIVDHATFARERDLDGLLREAYQAHERYFADVPRPSLGSHESFERWLEYGPKSPTFVPDASVYAVRDGRIVGMSHTDLRGTGVGYTFMTGVDREERGRGLALAMKLTMVAALRRRGVRWVGTSNDKDNAPMLAVNRKLGYVQDPPLIQVEKRLV